MACGHPAAHEVLYEVDLPACCQRAAALDNNPDQLDGGQFVRFECPACGAGWKREEQEKTLVLEGEARLQQYEPEYDERGVSAPEQLVVGDWEIAEWVENNIFSRGSWGRFPYHPYGSKLPRLRITVELLEEEG